jgi:hypothetical protein
MRSILPKQKRVWGQKRQSSIQRWCGLAKGIPHQGVQLCVSLQQLPLPLGFERFSAKSRKVSISAVECELGKSLRVSNTLADRFSPALFGVLRQLISAPLRRGLEISNFSQKKLHRILINFPLRKVSKLTHTAFFKGNRLDFNKVPVFVKIMLPFNKVSSISGFYRNPGLVFLKAQSVRLPRLDVA